MNQTAIFINNCWYWLSCAGWKKMMEFAQLEDKIFDLFEQGLSVSKIAKQMELEYHVVYHIITPTSPRVLAAEGKIRVEE